jgi:hypothetical protein
MPLGNPMTPTFVSTMHKMKTLIAACGGLLLWASCASAQPVIYTGPGNGIGNNTATFNAAVTRVCASTTTRTLLIPVGKYRFGSAPAAIPCALNLVGEGKAVSWLIKDYAPGVGSNTFIQYIGGQDGYGGGSVRDLSLMASPAGFGSIALYVQPLQETDPTQPSKAPHGLRIENVQIGRYSTTDGGWSYGIYLDGSRNAGVSGVAPGIRAVTIRNVSVNFTSTLSYVLYAAFGIKLFGVDCFGASNGVWIGGGSSIIDVYSPSCAVQNAGASSVFTVN